MSIGHPERDGLPSPGLEALGSSDCDGGHCVTCGDEGLPATVVRVDDARGLALCAMTDGTRATVETALVDPVGPGDRLLIHAGTAIAALAPVEQEAPT